MKDVRNILGIICTVLMTVHLSFGQVSDAALTTQSNVIRDESVAGANTRVRIAAMFQAIIDSKVSLVKFPAPGTLGSSLQQLRVNAAGNGIEWYTPAGAAVWGSITGTITDQTDLMSALNLKAPLASPTFTGTVSGITSIMVGLGNVDNTSDANKPVSTAQAAADALNLKIASNLSDLNNAGTARTNLGLGTLATQNGTAPSGPIVGTTDTQTLSGKTLTSPIINYGSDANGDIMRRSGGVYGRLGIGSTGDVLTVSGGLPVWLAPSAGFTNPMTTLGDIIYENSTPAAARLAGNTTTTNKFLSQVGNGSISAAPSWSALVSSDIPNNAANTSGNAATVTTIPTLSGDVSNSGNAITVTKINGTSLAGLTTGIVKNTTSTGVPSIAVAGDFPTLNQNTTGSAATLTTSRKINQVSFNGSADIKLNSRSSKTANYSVVSTDAMTTIMANPSADITFTIDQLTADDWILVKNKGTFNVLFAAGSGVTITGLTTLGPGYDALIYFDTSTAAQITGGGVATNGVSVVYKSMTTTGASGSSETTLFSYTLPAGTLGTNGESILIQSAGSYATSVNSKTIKFKFGGTTVSTGALAITTTAPWWLEASIIRVDATNQKIIVALITGSSTQLAEAVYSTATETLSGTVTISITGQGGATNDVVGEFVKMKKEGF
jgi:hypothetical protein